MGQLYTRQCTHCKNLEEAVTSGVCKVTPHKVITIEDDDKALNCQSYNNKWGLSEEEG